MSRNGFGPSLLGVLAASMTLAASAGVGPGSGGRTAGRSTRGDTAWVLTASALVLMMTLPGLALFYGGLVRAKNVLNVLMQCFLSAGIVGVLWILVGYSLAFGTGNAFIGDFSKVGLAGVTIDSVMANFASPPRNIPEYVFIMFQAMFAIITPALILGAIAERMKFSVWVAFITVWLLVVYCPIAHMVWAVEGWIFKSGAIDFAGGLVVHMSSGFSAIVAAHHARQAPRLRQGADAAAQPAAVPDRRGPAVDRLVRLQRRQRAQREPARGARVPQHEHRGLDRGRRLGADRVDAPRQADRARRRDRGGRGSGRDHARPAATSRRWARSRSALGVAVISYAACTFLKPALGYDDSLDVFGVHALGGAWGALASGIFAITLGSGIEIERAADHGPAQGHRLRRRVRADRDGRASSCVLKAVFGSLRVVGGGRDRTASTSRSTARAPTSPAGGSFAPDHGTHTHSMQGAESLSHKRA